ncbi:hypothetical protein [Clostridium saccharoperbutylacetonicum]|uniref:hypothetical protein n=1 Tax=Clostridium saccharoperbutylacetonicum TaxID=36745 RepID=UPI000983AE99|nr:hypothetical protein [Clostridium saccharoperbutylacetonicum]AQR93393.1 hypothetical protein CLSAP_06910 [Clostridium saccharoperbutylacetonicum]NSB29090.1 hypothetical protein [Clostridium saccharoperbutylacetonicum]
MNLELMTYRNYKHLCSVMGWMPTTGKGRTLQIKDLERYCKYHKEGQKFIIDEIFLEPLPKEENKRNSVYAENIDKLIVHMCSKTENSEYHHSEFSVNGILNELHIINKNYSIGRNNIDKFSRYLEVPFETLYDFFNSQYKKNKDIVEGSLNRLKNKCLIDWYMVTKVHTVDGEYRKATDGELEAIKEYEQLVLENLKLQSKKDVFLKGKWNQFQKGVSQKLREEMQIRYYFENYHIVSTKKFRAMLLEARQKENIELELNYDIQKSAIKSAESRHTKAFETFGAVSTSSSNESFFGKRCYDKDKNRLTDNYVDDTRKVVRICIDITDQIDLGKALKGIEGGRYKYHDTILTETQKEWMALANSKEMNLLFG